MNTSFRTCLSMVQCVFREVGGTVGEGMNGEIQTERNQRR